MSPRLVLFFRLMVRPLAREPLRTGLTALAVALGVAVVLAIELAGGAAAGSFRSSLETLTGDADYEITGTGGVPPETVARLARLPHDLTVRPRIEVYAVVADTGRTVPLIGLDLLAETPAGKAGEPGGGTEIFERDDWVWTGGGLRSQSGARLTLWINDRAHHFTVRGALGDAAGDAVVMDLAAAARLLRRDGALDRVLVRVPERAPPEGWEAALAAALPGGLKVAPFGARTEENRRKIGRAHV